MNRCLYFFLVVAVGSFALTPHAASAVQEVDVHVAGFSVVEEDPDSEYGGSRVPGLSPGVSVFLTAIFSEKTAIRILDRDDSSKVEVKDSTGQVLAGAKLNEFMSEISDDGKSVLFRIDCPDMPAKNAKAISTSGFATVQCGTDSTTDEVSVTLRVDSKVKLAGIDCEVNGIQESFVEEDHQSVQFQAKESFARIQKMEAVMSDGSTLEMRPSGNSQFGFGDDMTYTRDYDVPGQASDVQKIKVTYFQNSEHIKVPFDVTFGPGLSPVRDE